MHGDRDGQLDTKTDRKIQTDRGRQAGIDRGGSQPDRQTDLVTQSGREKTENHRVRDKQTMG